MKTLRIFLAVSVVLEVLLNTRTDYQRELEQCTTQECADEANAKIDIVQREIDAANGVRVTWTDITTAIIPNSNGGQ